MTTIDCKFRFQSDMHTKYKERAAQLGMTLNKFADWAMSKQLLKEPARVVVGHVVTAEEFARLSAEDDARCGRTLAEEILGIDPAEEARKAAERQAAIREEIMAAARETAKLYAAVPVSVQSFRDLAQSILDEPDVTDWEPGESYEEFERRYEAQKWVMCHAEIDGRVTPEDHQATGLIRVGLIRDVAAKELRCRSKERQAAIDAEWQAKYAENAKRVKAMKGVTASDIDA